MKLFIALVCLALSVSVITATSPPRCPLDGSCWKCDKIDPPCRCGTYKDYCNCCDLCMKCPGEECNILAGQKCADGYRCKNSSGRHPGFDPYGKCVEE